MANSKIEIEVALAAGLRGHWGGVSFSDQSLLRYLALPGKSSGDDSCRSTLVLQVRQFAANSVFYLLNET